MAGRKKQAKTPKFLQKITVDNLGRIRVGGKFISKRSLGSIKAARTRKGLKTVIPKGPPKELAAKRRSQASKKAAKTRRLGQQGVKFISDRTTSRLSLRFISYEITAPTPDIIRLTIDTAIKFLKQKESDTLLVFPVVDVIDDDGEDFTVSNNRGFFRNAKGRNIVNQLIDDIAALENKYQVASVERYSLVFTVQG